MRKNSAKNQRINGEVTRELAQILREVKDPRIGMMTSVMDACVAPDLKTCKVYISVYGDEQVQKETMEGLGSAKGYIRRELAHRLNLRNTPELTFILDRSIGRGVEMSKKIDEVIRHDEESVHGTPIPQDVKKEPEEVEE